jgi:hypothetical protein
MRDSLVIHDNFASHVCMILQPISAKFTFHFTVLILVYYDVHVLASSLETENVTL